MKKFLTSLSVFSIISMCNSVFAERNPDVQKACEQYKHVVALPLTEYAFDFRNFEQDPLDSEKDVVSEHFKCTFYKGNGSDSKSYYKSSEDRDNYNNPLKFDGVIAMPLLEAYSAPNFSKWFQEYEKFFHTCGLKAEIPIGYFTLSIDENDFDPVRSAFGLQNSEWFATVMPVTWHDDTDEVFDAKHDCVTVCSNIEECRKTDPIS